MSFKNLSRQIGDVFQKPVLGGAGHPPGVRQHLRRRRRLPEEVQADLSASHH